MERASREVWAKRVERWKDSGLTAKEFAAELDVSASSLTFWKWKLGRLAHGEPLKPRKRRKPRAEGDAHTSPKFLQLVPTTAARDVSGSFEVVFVSGVVVRVPHDFDDSALTRLVGVLGGR
jgi:transposase